MINVTRSALPPLEEYIQAIAPLWENRWLTNMGSIHQQFEGELREFLHSNCVTLFTNGHLALEGALEALECKGEIITTPFTFASIPFGDVEAGQELVSEISLDLKGIVPGSYYLGCEFHEIDSAGTAIWHDYMENMLQIEILENQVVKPGLPDNTNKIPWNHNAWGCLRLEAGMEDRT